MSIDTSPTGSTGSAAVTSSTQQWVRLTGEDDDRSIDRFELFSARRALNLLKTKLGRERLLELLGDEIAAGDAFLKGHVEGSGEAEVTATLSVTLPATCAPDVVEQHLEHFAVEFRTWILRAATEQVETTAGGS